ncbi:iron-siderophore ABC transporter substrate-binding protein [Poseidonocella sp. HB161398]|uniref:iron-siderophore ABC transporter substrate-binding protein n=1 Tax=Poseidonocella sp. HB161398 TaxID=2320855 RepID=UPI001108BCE2|nr:iron-siderophore ABC transporter substrate-binding protein [Poseidonocella sp. HB161398]
MLRRLARQILTAAALLAAPPALADTFPVTVSHVFGTTVIPAPPKRVATVNWANHEVPLALGIVPVGFARANFGDDDGDGMLPWVKARLDELGGPAPVLFDEGDGIDFEAVAATRPDVILAAHSGMSREDYELLSRIAPVVAYPDAPWTTDWRSMIRLNAAGLGMSAEGEALIARTEAEIAAEVAKYPELEGRTAMFITHLEARDLSQIRFYSANDTRVKFFEDLGLRQPASVREATRPGQYAAEISAERIDLFDDVDIVLTYGDDALLERLEADPLTSHMAPVARGSVVLLSNDPAGTAAHPTPLGISWVLPDYVAKLAAAARNAE